MEESPLDWWKKSEQALPPLLPPQPRMRPLACLLPALLAIVAGFAASVRCSRRQLVAYAVLATPFAFLHAVLPVLCFDQGTMTSEHARAGAGGPQSPIHLDKGASVGFVCASATWVRRQQVEAATKLGRYLDEQAAMRSRKLPVLGLFQMYPKYIPSFLHTVAFGECGSPVRINCCGLALLVSIVIIAKRWSSASMAAQLQAQLDAQPVAAQVAHGNRPPMDRTRG
ncbi:uncharacterized protein LOC144098280 [Amblyomma americanum]